MVVAFHCGLSVSCHSWRSSPLMIGSRFIVSASVTSAVVVSVTSLDDGGSRVVKNVGMKG